MTREKCFVICTAVLSLPSRFGGVDAKKTQTPARTPHNLGESQRHDGKATNIVRGTSLLAPLPSTITKLAHRQCARRHSTGSGLESTFPVWCCTAIRAAQGTVRNVPRTNEGTTSGGRLLHRFRCHHQPQRSKLTGLLHLPVLLLILFLQAFVKSSSLYYIRATARFGKKANGRDTEKQATINMNLHDKYGENRMCLFGLSFSSTIEISGPGAWVNVPTLPQRCRHECTKSPAYLHTEFGTEHDTTARRPQQWQTPST